MELVVILPVFNEAHGLEKVLSQIEQSSRQFPKINTKCVIVDDGSTDCSAEIIERWRQESGMYVLFHRMSRNEGLTRTLKLAHYTACGLSPDYILRVDADGHLPINYFLEETLSDLPKGSVVVASRNSQSSTDTYEQERRADFMRIVEESNNQSSKLSKPLLWVPDQYKIKGLPAVDPSSLGYQFYDGSIQRQLILDPLVSIYENPWGFDYLFLIIANKLGKPIKVINIPESTPNVRTKAKVDEIFDTYIDIVSIPLGHRSNTLSRFYKPPKISSLSS